MRILLLLHGWPPAAQGGTGIYVSALARALAEQGQEVRLLCPVSDLSGHGPPRLSELPAHHGCRAFALHVAAPRRWEETWQRPAADALLLSWLARWRPDVVHLHHLAHSSWGWVQPARRAGSRVVLTLHDYALPCARGQLVTHDLRPCDGPSAAACSRCLAPHLALSPALSQVGRRLASLPRLRASLRASLHHTRAPDADARHRVEARALAVSTLLSLPHRLLAPSHDLCARFEALGLRRPEHHHLPLVRPVRLAPPPPEGPLRILFAGSMIPTKGPDRLLAAFSTLPVGQASLSLAGASPDFDGAPSWAAKLRRRADTTPGARWLGEQRQDQMDALLAAHDLLVLPSIWPENSPLIVREATAAGLRVVVPEAGGAKELAPDAPRVSWSSGTQLASVLRQEVARGRGRVRPMPWPSPQQHAAWLLRVVYGLTTG